jgi:MFS transporter, DHA2 family, multidrug resistance protein
MTYSPPARAGLREWWGLAVLTLPALLASMDLSVLFMAVPWITADLEPTGSQMLWIVDIYGFVLAGLLITMGSLGDRIGRRRLLMIGATLFGIASVLAAYAPTTEALILARALLGAGGATLAPSTLSLLRTLFRDERQRGVAIGVWTVAFSGGFVIGPIVGGLLLEFFWWGSVFLINVPVMVLLLILAPLMLPESSDPAAARLDLPGAALSIAAILPIVYGIKEIAEGGLGAAPLAVLAVGLAFGAAFLRRQATVAHPLIDIRLFRRSAFSASLGANTMLTFATAGLGMLVVQHLQLVLGFSPFTAALWMLPLIVGTVAGATIASFAGRWIRPGFLVGTGLSVIACGFVIVAQLQVDSGAPLLIGGFILVTLGSALAASLSNGLILTTAPSERAGSAAATAETGAEFGGALGIAVLGSISVAAYRSALELPDDLPGPAQEAARTLGGAEAVAEQLPTPLGDELIVSAQTAFTTGFATAATIGACLLFATGALTAFLLRGTRPVTAAPEIDRAA